MSFFGELCLTRVYLINQIDVIYPSGDILGKVTIIYRTT